MLTGRVAHEFCRYPRDCYEQSIGSFAGDFLFYWFVGRGISQIQCRKLKIKPYACNMEQSDVGKDLELMKSLLSEGAQVSSAGMQLNGEDEIINRFHCF